MRSISDLTPAMKEDDVGGSEVCIVIYLCDVYAGFWEGVDVSVSDPSDAVPKDVISVNKVSGVISMY